MYEHYSVCGGVDIARLFLSNTQGLRVECTDHQFYVEIRLFPSKSLYIV